MTESNLTIVTAEMQGRVPVTVLHLTGDLDGNTYEQLQKKADEVFQSGARYILLDLSQVPFVSSAGIRGLHYVFNLLRTDSVAESDQAISKGLRDGTLNLPTSSYSTRIRMSATCSKSLATICFWKFTTTKKKP